MQRLDHILEDNEGKTLVNLPSGKISSANGERTAIAPQKGECCILKVTRRLAYFDVPGVKSNPKYQAYRRIKSGLSADTMNFSLLLAIFKEACRVFNIDTDQIISATPSNSVVIESNSCSLLYAAIIRQGLLPLFNLQESAWHPKAGFSGLKESLRKHGAHAFIGKYGARFHKGDTSRYDVEDTNNREVYFFEKGSYIGDQERLKSHAIIVDQVKIVSGKEMVFFRDPADESCPSKTEIVYMISYKNFIQRLTNYRSQQYATNDCQDEKSFGIVSSDPTRLIK